MKIIKRLFPYLRPHRGTIIFTLCLGVMLSGITLGTAKLVKDIIDQIFVQKNPQMLRLAPLVIIGLYIVGGVIRYVHMYLLRYTGDVVAYTIRNDLQAKFAQMNLDYYAENTTGALISKTMNDVINVQAGLSLVADAIREPINLVLMLGALFYMNWKLTCLVFFSAPVLIIASKNLSKSVRKYSLLQQQTMELFTSVLKETLDGIRVVKAFGLEKHMEGKFQAVTDKILAVRRKILSREELAGPVFELLAATVLAGILYYAGYQVVRGESTTGTFTAFIFLLGSLQQPIKKLQDAHVRVQHTVASSERIFEVLDTPTTVRDPEDDGRASHPWPADWDTIEFKEVRFGYNDKPVLQGIDLKVRRGEVVAIVGSSGSGKSTLVNLIPRFYDVTSGAIFIGGVDIRDMKVQDLRSHIGLVTQDVFLFNESIRENILAGKMIEDAQATAEAVQAAVGAAHATDFVSRMPHQLDTVVGERGSQLSGGERQRISIARAIFKNTPVLILDEATSSLDSESEKIVQAALDRLMVGRTTFVIAHRLSTIQKATRILVLSEGKIVEQGSHQELLNRGGAYHRLHVNQFGSASLG